jgi:hypothetical protein
MSHVTANGNGGGFEEDPGDAGLKIREKGEGAAHRVHVATTAANAGRLLQSGKSGECLTAAKSGLWPAVLLTAVRLVPAKSSSPPRGRRQEAMSVVVAA